MTKKMHYARATNSPYPMCNLWNTAWGVDGLRAEWGVYGLHVTRDKDKITCLKCIRILK